MHDFTGGSSGAGSALQAALASASSKFEPNDREQALAVAWKSSPVASIATWKSPVLLIHGDDDRNVRFGQTVDLVVRLRKQGVPFEEIVIPDEVHDFLLHRSWVRALRATPDFFDRHLLRGGAPARP